MINSPSLGLCARCCGFCLDIVFSWATQANPVLEASIIRLANGGTKGVRFEHEGFRTLSDKCHGLVIGGCKHALALLMWTHRRSEDPTPTEVACYWKKSRLSGIGTVIKYIEAEKLTKKTSTTPVENLPDNSTFLI
ncbi:unnamed protein product [Leptidea sinapis]|uniref:SWIM-type domain-containing protein n=1 Tax=Leptidea sinapis TaxID=189913 RepID=A0A5E4PPB4_9NEOP|nr:unnamed protein product [Leptidea sinapis]